LNALGTLYEEGKYVGRDLKKSFNFFMKSAKMGDSEGLYKIGKFLEKGWLNAKQYFEGLYSNREGEVRGAI
jgi:TPR repeat protein